MLDHGILNVPLAKRGDIDAQIDRYKAEQKRQAALKRKADAAILAGQPRQEKAHRPEGQRANSGGRFAPVIRWGGDWGGGHLGRRGGCWFGNVDQWPALRMRPRRIGDAMPMHIRPHLFNREIASALSLKRGAVIGRDAVAPAVHRGGSQAQHARNSRRATKVFYCDHGRIVRSAYTKAQACEQPRENTYK